MIRSLSFSNFYSFNNKQAIDFTASRKDGYDYYNSDSGKQITKIASFIGTNASGKTNFSRVLGYLKFFITSEVSLSSEMPIDFEYKPYKTFFNNVEPTEIAIVFESGKNIYHYSVKLNNNKIKHEKLVVKSISKAAKPRTVFIRKKNDITELNDSMFKGIDKRFFEKIKDDVSFIPYVQARFSVETINSVYSYFGNIKTNINESGKSRNFYNQMSLLDEYLKDKKLKKKMEDLISNFDIGLKSFKINKINNRHDYRIEIDGIHNTKEINNTLNFKYESRGTQNLFFVLGQLLTGLRDNSVIVIDEIESGFHPEALNKILTYFVDENSDGTAQLFFTSHSFPFLNKLDMHQIYLVEKDSNSISSCIRLSDIEGIRPDENFLTKYLSGKYGAFPNIRI